jgi:signal transduction histidine kinase
MPEPVFSPPDRATRSGVVVLTVVVFAVVVGFVTLRLRDGLQRQILQGKAAELTAVASMQLANEAESLGVNNAPGALFAAVLRTSKLGGVIGVRVLDAKKNVVGANPWVWSEDPPVPADWDALVAGRPLARLHARDSAEVLPWLSGELTPEERAVPLFEAWVPLRQSKNDPVLGAAQFWLSGTDVAADFAALNTHLFAQAALAWLAGSLVIVVALAWAFRRLADANRELRTHSENLQRANRELVLSAKTSALGTITAHLIHALKNPLAGLEVFVANQAEPNARADGGEELAAATELTRRLRTMVNDVVSVLRDEQGAGHFELSGGEVVELALAKAQPSAASRRVQLTAENSTATALPARRANLAALVLYNLLQNAIEASPAGTRVRVASDSREPRHVEFTVEDEAGGLPESVRAHLFEPCTSSKLGGSGLGLALSQQLARQAGGKIELVRSDPHGTCFRLVLDSDA